MPRSCHRRSPSGLIPTPCFSITSTAARQARPAHDLRRAVSYVTGNRLSRAIVAAASLVEVKKRTLSWSRNPV